jgi:hypothetical protein
MSTSLDAQQLTTLLRLSSEPDIIGDDHPCSGPPRSQTAI